MIDGVNRDDLTWMEETAWTIGDAKAALVSAGHVPSEDNLVALFDQFPTNLFQERMAELGWQVIDTLLGDLSFDDDAEGDDDADDDD